MGNNTWRPTRAEWELLRDYRDQGMSWREIAKKRGMDYTAVYKRAKKLQPLYGVLAESTRSDMRNYAHDYIRIKNLKVDSRVGWDLVARTLGLSRGAVQSYWIRLKRIYEPHNIRTYKPRVENRV